MSKKKEDPKVRCMECAKAALLQWDNNPVIAHCDLSSYGNVANSLRTCAGFKPSSKAPVIRKLTHYK